MPGHGRPRWRVSIVACAALVCFALTRLTTAADPPDALRADAQLADVAFVDAEHGWTVGDRGVIWHTSNGGEDWQLQPSGSDARLNSVRFLDRERGWAAGGWIEPHSRVSRGVLLHTSDGGQHWKADSRLTLPLIRQIRFLDAKNGWAVTESSALSPPGLYHTNDGGRSWSPASSADDRCWMAGDFSDAQTGVVVGRFDMAAVVRRQSIEAPVNDFVNARSLRAVKLLSPREAWAVGDGGAVRASRDYGRRWQPMSIEPPAADGDSRVAIAEQFDFLALDAIGPCRWIVGSPGSMVFCSTDAGKSWTTHATGQTLPLRSVAFSTVDRGWAVGDLGVILATHDGGRSWRIQRQGGSRAALLGIFADMADAPCELFVKLAEDEGYRSAMQIACRPLGERFDTLTADRESRLQHAAVSAGAVAGYASSRFTAPPRRLGGDVEQLRRLWDTESNGRGADAIETELVKCIRTWRPSVIVTSVTDQRSNATAATIARHLLVAVQKANDASACQPNMTYLGLAPWRVEKVFGAMPLDQNGTINLSTSQFSSRRGMTLADAARRARGLLGQDAFLGPANFGFRLLLDQLPQEQGRRDFFSGLNLSPGGDARRSLVATGDAATDSLRRGSQSRRNLQAMMTRAVDHPDQAKRLLADLSAFSRDLPKDQTAELIFQAGLMLQRQGQLELAAETFAALATEMPDAPLAGAALEWLVRYYASGELAWRRERRQQATVQNVVAAPPEIEDAEPSIFDSSEVDVRPSASPHSDNRGTKNIERNNARSNLAAGDDRADRAPIASRSRSKGLVLPAGGVNAAARIDRGQARVASLRGADDRIARAMAYAGMLEERHPQLHADPATRFALAAAQRNLGGSRQAERIYLGFRRVSRRDVWWDCAQGEAWLAEPRGAPPKTSCRAARASAPPHLDGKLDEPFWKSSGRARLLTVELDAAKAAARQKAQARPQPHRDAGQSADDDAFDPIFERQAQERFPAEVLFGHDDEFLYIGIECVKTTQSTPTGPTTARERDADLSRNDRVEILLDIDRDWTTWYRLVVDSRGWTFDDCWQDASWNPTWYVAAAENEQVWSVEAAIPLIELVGAPPNARDTWALGAQRIMPGVGLQSWTEPADIEPRGEGFGWLTFE